MGKRIKEGKREGRGRGKREGEGERREK